MEVPVPNTAESKRDAVAFFATEPITIPSKDGTELWFRTWKPADSSQIRASVIFVHAIGGHSSRHDYTYTELAKRGIEVHAFDQRNHGNSSLAKSEKMEDLMEDLNAALNKAIKRDTSMDWPNFIFGSGNGSVLVLEYILDRISSETESVRPRIDGIILGAPVIARRGKSAFRASWSRVKGTFSPNSEASTAYKDKRLSRDPEVINAMKQDKLVKSHTSLSVSNSVNSHSEKVLRTADRLQLPLLVLYGDEDKIADNKVTRKFFEKISSSDKTLRTFPKLYHDILNEPEKDEVIGVIANWILSHSPKKPEEKQAEVIPSEKKEQQEDKGKGDLKVILSNDATVDEKELKAEDLPPKESGDRATAPEEQTKPQPPEGAKKEKKVVPGKRTAVDFEFGDVLGEGAFGEVRRAKEIKTGQEFAVKMLNKKHILSSKKEKYVHTERNIFNSLSHPNTVKLWYTFQDPTNLYYVLELCPNGDLASSIKKLGRFPEECARFYAAEIISGLEHMHSKGIVHRDLKPDNVLLDPQYHAKLTDFGTSKIIGSEQRARSESFCGTEAYVSPELLHDEDPFASKASDLWALGVIIYQMLVGKLPFKGETQFQTFEKIKKREFSFPSEDPLSDAAKDLINQLLTIDPEERIGQNYQSLKQHPFFAGLDFDTLPQQTPPLRDLIASVNGV
eukprot:TRINITY_DN2123_c0_g1_i1.p1 TRINITY_DN2123_c0_g1~~TRINITY_DN2123_c0_g1_i1.p1  ORF type:complete len:677 (+),score=141.54 TRINITY_DN2123_c0_g1_i1:144-2174(+)